jgi:SAM-dependent methyltransferase
MSGSDDNLGNDIASQDGETHFRKIPVRWVPFLEADTTNPVYADTLPFVLHVACADVDLPKDEFKTGEWVEVRLDIDTKCRADLFCSMTDMGTFVASDEYDVVYCSHAIEHLFFHDVLLALKEFHRVLKPGGELRMYTPDLMAICSLVLSRDLEAFIYESDSGPITPLDMLYGHRGYIANGRSHMAHRTGFTRASLTRLLGQIGFTDVKVTRREQIDLKVSAKK